MELRELFKGIFDLAIKLVGLIFLYYGLRDVPPILQLPTMPGYTATDFISTILPAVFNLIVGWWLVGNKFLVRRAYPETPRLPGPGRPGTSSGPGKPTDKSGQPTATSKEEDVEKKLVELLKKPKNTDSGQGV